MKDQTTSTASITDASLGVATSTPVSERHRSVSCGGAGTSVSKLTWTQSQSAGTPRWKSR
ncbi:unnamed protein product, partial [Ixodes pacificus]